jgi:hypothetical protein
MIKPSRFLRVWIPNILFSAFVWVFVSRGNAAERALQSMASGSVSYMVTASITPSVGTRSKDEESDSDLEK